MNEKHFLWVGALCGALVACGSSEEGTGGTGGGAGSHAGAAGSSTGGAGGGAAGGSAGASGGAAGTTGGGAAGTTGGGAAGATGGAAGAAGATGGAAGATGGAAGATGGGGAGGAARDGGPTDAADAAPRPDARDAPTESTVPEDAASPFSCLPNGEEHLVVHIAGTPSLDIVNPGDALCLSRYLPGNDDSGAQLNLQWSVGSATISAVVRLYDAIPGQTGTFNPFAVSISREGDSWLGLNDKCHVTVSASQRIGTGAPANYKVTGSMACDAEWALGKPDAVLQQFEFTTKVAGYP
jgi:hypothetical protein